MFAEKFQTLIKGLSRYAPVTFPYSNHFSQKAFLSSIQQNVTITSTCSVSGPNLFPIKHSKRFFHKMSSSTSTSTSTATTLFMPTLACVIFSHGYIFLITLCSQKQGGANFTWAINCNNVKSV
uniref:Uncharacterized protein n=1 Tax=Glossina pallidipes TaxID=7398 RepID=A0A1A9ZSB1_GLOPL